MKNVWGRKQKLILWLCIAGVLGVFAGFCIYINTIVPPRQNHYIPQGESCVVDGMELTVEKSELLTFSEVMQRTGFSEDEMKESMKSTDTLVLVQMKEANCTDHDTAISLIDGALQAGAVKNQSDKNIFLTLNKNYSRTVKAGEERVIYLPVVFSPQAIPSGAAAHEPGKQLEYITASYPVVQRFLLDPQQ